MVLGAFQVSSPQLKRRSSSFFPSLFAETLNPAALTCHYCRSSQRVITHDGREVIITAIPSFRWIGHLPHGSWKVWKKTLRDKKKVKRSDSLFLRVKERSNRKDLSEGRRQPAKWKIAAKEKRLSCSQMLQCEMGSRCFVRRAGHLVTRVHGITHVRP